MVNTFVLFPSLSTSAKHLDLARLRKQCVEAYQIRSLLEQLNFIAQSFHLPSCPPIESASSLTSEALMWTKSMKWVTDTKQWYMNQNRRLLNINGQWSHCDKNHLVKDITKWTDKDYYQMPNNVKYNIGGFTTSGFNTVDFTFKNINYSLPRNQVILSTDTAITLGFGNHPAVKMWAGYEPALEYYINAHCQEYNSRNSKNNIKIPYYNIPNYVLYPWWLRTPHVINSHRGSLWRKEVINHEPEHYQKYFPEYANYPFGYLWPSSLSDDQIFDMCNSQTSKSSWHAEINNKPSRKLGWKLTVTKTGSHRYYYDGKAVAQDKVDPKIKQELTAKLQQPEQSQEWQMRTSDKGQLSYYFEGKRIAKSKVPSEIIYYLNSRKSNDTNNQTSENMNGSIATTEDTPNYGSGSVNYISDSTNYGSDSVLANSNYGSATNSSYSSTANSSYSSLTNSNNSSTIIANSDSSYGSATNSNSAANSSSGTNSSSASNSSYAANSNSSYGSSIIGNSAANSSYGSSVIGNSGTNSNYGSGANYGFGTN